MNDKAKIILISGTPASGKSSLAKLIGNGFGLPVFSADSLKEVLFDHIDVPKPKTAERKKIGGASFELLYHIMERCLAAKTVAVCEAHFYPPWSEDRLKRILSEYDAEAFYIHCSADRSVIERRFRERASSAERHPGHRDPELIRNRNFPDLLFESDFRPELGIPIHRIDTSDFDSIDFDGLSGDIDRFLKR
ncbi:MAG: AAA family ATPase [Candidatus Moranbacteria bacterium]|nr:AAA family ATPase [Candidatus Moranbacteria bacterium]